MAFAHPRPIAPSNFALRTLSRAGSGDWLVLVVPDNQSTLAIERLSEDLRGLGGEVIAAHVTDHPVEELVQAIGTPGSGGVLLVGGLDELADEEWRHIDLLRSRLIGAGTVVLVVSQETASRIGRSAPNLASWVGGSVWALRLAGDMLSNEEREERLKALRRWSGLTDEEVVRGAVEGSLPDDPEYTEWLILLDRADLVAP